MKTKVHLSYLLVLTIYFGCNNGADFNFDSDEVIPGETPNTLWYTPAPGTTFDWQLDDVSNASFSTTIVDIDAFDSSKETVARLQSEGNKVIAYISVGTIEDWRPDVAAFPNEVIGATYDGWEGERWLDIRNLEVLAPIIESRLDMAVAKGFDGIEPDNMDVYEYPDPGFDISREDQIAYCKWLTSAAHERGLSIGQKNAGDLADQLVDQFDWMLTEDAYADEWYNQAEIYIEKGKAVFVVEYFDNMNSSQFQNEVCPSSKPKHFSAILKERELGAGMISCW